ncbi:MAG: matrixin family metalloprotease [Phycisphaerales bacterium]
MPERGVRACALLGAGMLVLAMAGTAEAGEGRKGSADPDPFHPPRIVVPNAAWMYEPMSIGFAEPPAYCYDRERPPPPEMMAAVERMVYQSLLRYNLDNSWPGTDGNPISLTWSFIPDGTNIPAGVSGEASGPSDLFAQMDAKFGGNRALWIAQFQASFDRWAALTGTSYTRVTAGGNDWDDGAAFPGSASAAARGDVRIGGKNIDGGNGILAYNYYPTNGDMVMDTSENWASSGGSFIFLRNTILHEHGHGMGLRHVCPSNSTKLMEPFLNTGFDGPRHDDVRGGVRMYGDPYESNNTQATATALGALAPGATVNPSTVPAPAVANGSRTAISVDGDVDWYLLSFAAANTVSVTVAPVGLNYDAATQNANGSCNSNEFVDSLSIAALGVEVRAANGTTVLASNTAALGATASVSNVAVAAGNFYVRVFETGAPTQSQLYNLTITAGSTPAPGNDQCANATTIGFGTVSGSTAGALSDGAATCRTSATLDVWYQITPNCTGTLTVDTCGSAMNTVVSVHSGCPGNGGNQLACNDDNTGAGPCPGGTTSYLTVPVTAGTTYRIRVAAFGGATGTFNLRTGFIAPANDACASATAVNAGATVTGQTCGATNDGSATCGASSSSPDVWHTFTPACSGPVTITTCGSNYDTVLSLHTGACGSLSQVACNDDAGTAVCPTLGTNSALTADVTAGTTYRIRVSGFNGASGSYTLNVGSQSVANDLCVDAITVGNGSHTGSTCASTRDGGDTCRPTATAGDVWYRWVAPCTGSLVLNTCGSGYDTLLSVHSACPGSSANQLACNDDNGGLGPCPGGLTSYLSTPVTAGAAYFIRVSGYAALTGAYVLNIAQQANDPCADAATAPAGVTAFDTRCATADGSASCGLSASSPDVWFAHVPACTGPLWIDLCGSAYDTVVSLHSGACGSLTELGCNDDQGARCASSGLHSFLAARVTAGTQYRIRVSGYNGLSGTGTMRITCCPADFNLSGVVSVQDLFDYLAAYFAGDPNADVNASGALTVQDLFDYMALYFAGCA